MPSCLTQRKAQLELLAAACASRRPARVTWVATSAEKHVINTRLLTYAADGLLLDWPPAGTGDIPTRGALLEVSFEHEGQHYAIRSRALGRVWWPCEPHRQVAAWRLAPPLRVERKQRRAHCRVSLADLDPIETRFTNTVDPECSFSARLTNISPGGLGAVIPLSEHSDFPVGELFWANFKLPTQAEPFEFVVRLAHAHAVGRNDTVVMGYVFCPSDDPTRQRHQLGRIERFVAQRQCTQLRHTSPQLHGRG